MCNREKESVAKAGEVIVALLFYMGLFMWCVNMCEKEGDRVGVFFLCHCVCVCVFCFLCLLVVVVLISDLSQL